MIWATRNYDIKHDAICRNIVVFLHVIIKLKSTSIISFMLKQVELWLCVCLDFVLRRRVQLCSFVAIFVEKWEDSFRIHLKRISPVEQVTRFYICVWLLSHLTVKAITINCPYDPVKKGGKKRWNPPLQVDYGAKHGRELFKSSDFQRARFFIIFCIWLK